MSQNAYYICDPIYILTYVTTSHTVHIASPLLPCRIAKGALCYQFCHRGKVFKSLRSCRKNLTALGVHSLTWVNCALPSKGAHRTQADSDVYESVPTLPACPLHQSFEPINTVTLISTTSYLQENMTVGELCKMLSKHLQEPKAPSPPPPEST